MKAVSSVTAVVRSWVKTVVVGFPIFTKRIFVPVGTKQFFPPLKRTRNIRLCILKIILNPNSKYYHSKKKKKGKKRVRRKNL